MYKTGTALMQAWRGSPMMAKKKMWCERDKSERDNK
jgi:hypothetical protein